MASYAIRRARPADGPEFLRLVGELAEFEKLSPPDPEAQKRLLDDAFASKPAYELYVAEADGSPGLAAYAIVLRTYSSFLARPTLYLEDIYLTPEHRGTGLSHQFVRFLAELAVDRGWGRIEGIVLEWNQRARRFYERTGARELSDWVFFRYDPAALQTLARQAS